MKRSVMVVMLAVVALPIAASAQQVRVFAARDSFKGALGGLAGADASCNQIAATAGLGGTWIAWLSTSTTNAVDRLNPGSGPFVRAVDTATVIANDVGDLTDGSLQAAIQDDEFGNPGPVESWTGTDRYGIATGATCNDWTSDSDAIIGLAGQADNADRTWTDLTLSGCGNTIHIYCFETISEPVDLIAELVGDVISLNLQQGVASSLDAKLDAALNALEDANLNNDVAAVGALQAFINAVEAQRGNRIPEEDADGLIAAAQAIIAQLSEE